MTDSINTDNEEAYTDSPKMIEDSQAIVPTLYSEEGNDDLTAFIPMEESTSYLVPTRIQQKREETRGHLALIFIIGFFAMLSLGGFFIILTRDPTSEKVKNLQDIFLTISGVLSGPLGFVVGYYFKKQEESEN